MRNVICFHKPYEPNGYLSNWYLSDFSVNGMKFSSMEQYMMYQKAVVFSDYKAAQQILSTSDVGKIRAIGRMVKNYDELTWNGLRQVIVCKGLMEKFRQNDNLRELLLETKPHILAECAVQDKIWGNGISMSDERRFQPDKWQGKNLLGFSLMFVRSELAESNEELHK